MTILFPIITLDGWAIRFLGTIHLANRGHDSNCNFSLSLEPYETPGNLIKPYKTFKNHRAGGKMDGLMVEALTHGHLPSSQVILRSSSQQLPFTTVTPEQRKPRDSLGRLTAIMVGVYSCSARSLHGLHDSWLVILRDCAFQFSCAQIARMLKHQLDSTGVSMELKPAPP